MWRSLADIVLSPLATICIFIFVVGSLLTIFICWCFNLFEKIYGKESLEIKEENMPEDEDLAA